MGEGSDGGPQIGMRYFGPRFAFSLTNRLCVYDHPIQPSSGYAGGVAWGSCMAELITYSGPTVSDRPMGPAPLSPALLVEPMLFLSGQVGIDPATGLLAATDFDGQVRQTLSNVKNLVEAAGMSMRDVVKVTNYLTRPEDFPALNEIYETFFEAPFPARSTVGITLNDSRLLYEIDVIAMRSATVR